MNTFDEQDDLIFDNKLDAQRDIIRQSLNEIANDIGMAMRDVGLNFPVYMTVRNSGDALVTIATPLDPSDTDWQQASAIVCRTLEERVGCGRLRGQELACAIANAGVDKCRRRDCRMIAPCGRSRNCSDGLTTSNRPDTNQIPNKPVPFGCRSDHIRSNVSRPMATSI